MSDFDRCAAPVPAGSGRETVPVCALCGVTDSTVLVDAAQDRQHRLAGVFALRRCSGCGLVRLSPRPDPSALGGYYPATEYSAYVTAAPVDDRRRLARVRQLLRSVALAGLGYPAPPALAAVGRRMPERVVRRAAYGLRGFPHHQPGGRMLDVGCGNGFMLARAARHGWATVGLDTSDAAADAARTQGHHVVVGAIDQVGFIPGSFQFVHMSHVLEHAADPLVMLTAVAEALAPGGRVYIETPNIASDGYARSGRYWFPLESPRHLWLFDADTLAQAVRAAGLVPGPVTGVPLPTTAWDSTFRREARLGRRLDPRPARDPLTRLRAAWQRTISRRTARDRPDRAEVIALWATK